MTVCSFKKLKSCLSYGTLMLKFSRNFLKKNSLELKAFISPCLKYYVKNKDRSKLSYLKCTNVKGVELSLYKMASGF